MKKIKVIHLPYNVGNNVYPLSKSLKDAGIRSDCLVFTKPAFGFDYDYLVSLRDKQSKVVYEFKKLIWLFRILFSYNTVHFHYGSSLAGRTSPTTETVFLRKLLKKVYGFYLNVLQIFELALYRIFRKRVFVTYQGDDARQGIPMAGFKYSLLSGVNADYYSLTSDKFKAKQIKRIAKIASAIYFVNPDLARVLPSNSQFIPYSHIKIKNWEKIERSSARKNFTVVHAPSNRGIKGTQFILDAIERVQLTHPELEFLLVENLNHVEAIEVYKSADLLIDQLLGGWYGGLTVEALALGIPVMCYLREDDFKFLANDFVNDLPIINVSIENLTSKVLDFMDMSQSEKNQLSQKSRDFVEKWHDCNSIAKRILMDYREAHQARL